MAAPEPVVEATEQGAGELGALYWREVERFMRGLVAANVNADGSVQLRLRPGGPPRGISVQRVTLKKCSASWRGGRALPGR